MPIFALTADADIFDLWGHIIFPEDLQKAQLYALSCFIDFCGEQPAIFDTYLQDRAKMDSFLEKGEGKRTNLKKKEKRLYDSLWSSLRSYVDAHGGFRALVQLTSSNEFRRAKQTAVDDGTLAGKMLYRMIQLHKAGIKASKEKACLIITSESYKSDYWVQNRRLKVTRGPLYRCWKNYSHVSHWWAAYWHLMLVADEQPRNLELNPYAPEGLPVFIAIAEWILHESQKVLTPLSSRRKFGAVLGEKAAYRVPPELPRENIPIKIEPLEPWVISLLAENYKSVKEKVLKNTS